MRICAHAHACVYVRICAHATYAHARVYADVRLVDTSACGISEVLKETYCMPKETYCMPREAYCTGECGISEVRAVRDF